MTTHTASRPSRTRQLIRASLTVATAGLLSVAVSNVPAAGAAPPVKHGRSTEAQLREILKSHQASGDFVGARIAVLEADGRFTEASAGTTTIERSSGPVDPDLEWNIGSSTKSFVAVVVLQLAEEGAIDLDAGIDSFMPELPGADLITPRQLLQHTSGLNEYINEPAVVNDANRFWSTSELIAVAEAAGRVGQPGQAFHYSNTNFIILGEIIQQVTGHRWSDEVRSRIVEPLGLTHTREITDQRAVGYKVADDGSFVDSTFSADPSIGGAAGALAGTSRDLVTFGKALRDGTLLSPESTTAMRTFVPGHDYSQYGIVHGSGLGLEQYATDTVTVNGHMGTGEAQSAYYGFDVERGTVVAVTTNVAVSGPQAIMAIEALTALAHAG